MKQLLHEANFNYMSIRFSVAQDHCLPFIKHYQLQTCIEGNLYIDGAKCVITLCKGHPQLS